MDELFKIFLRKDKSDSTNYLLRLLGGIEVGEAIDSLIAGKGIIADTNGRIQADRMELRSSLTVLELIFNRLSAIESDYSFPNLARLRVSNYWKMVPTVCRSVSVGITILQPWLKMILFMA